MYRAVTLKALQQNIPTEDTLRISEITGNISFNFQQSSSQTILFMDGVDVSHRIRTPEVNEHINPVAANSQVREILVKKQQELEKNGGVVMDGRDIGTVVFPNAELKIYMNASAEERAKRRVNEFALKNISIPYDEVFQEILTRDKADTTRAHGPLKIAEDAIIIDTTNLSISEQVKKIYELARKKIKEKNKK